MKKVKIASAVCVFIALVLEILPFGVIMRWDSFYQEATYHSYFDLKVFEEGDIGPFFCALLTAILLVMSVLPIFLKFKDVYVLATAFVALAAVVLSLIPTFYNGYSIFGLFITIALSVATELNFMQYVNRKRDANRL